MAVAFQSAKMAGLRSRSTQRVYQIYVTQTSSDVPGRGSFRGTMAVGEWMEASALSQQGDLTIDWGNGEQRAWVEAAAPTNMPTSDLINVAGRYETADFVE